MRERLLVRHFLTRFMEHDLISANADRRAVVAVVGGALTAVSLFTSVLIAAWYQLNRVPPGLTSVRSVDDRFLFVSASMLVMALLAVSQWDALSLDARDTAVLGILPIPKAVIIRAKFYAVAVLAAGTAVACNLAPTLFRFASVPINLPIRGRDTLILVLAHAVSTFSAGAFGFLAIFGLREALMAVFGQDRFRSISSALQAALLVVLASTLLLLPGSSMNVAHKWSTGEGVVTRSLPPAWFVGLNETLAGAVIDDLPHYRPQRFLVVRERNATDLYRSLWPLYRRQSRLAIEGLVAVALLTVVASAWNSRRLPAPGVRHRSRSLAITDVWKWAVARLVVTSSVQQAGFWFTLQTLPRRLNHRAALASSFAVGLSLVVFTVGERILTVHADVATVPPTILAVQWLLLASVLTGFRQATQVPSDLRASRTFSLAWTGDTGSYLSGVKRAAFVGLVLPILLILFAWHATVLGPAIAALHFAVGAVFSVLLIEVLFLRYHRLPFVSAYEPTVELKSHGVLYVLVMLVLSFVLAGIERFALGAMFRYVVLVSVAAGLGAAVTTLARVWRRSMMVVEIEDEPKLTTQSLGLAG